MSRKTGSFLVRPLVMAVLALAIPLVLGGEGAWAAVQYLGDGALQHAQGGWNLPNTGSCPADLSQTTRPDCLALRFSAYTTSADCTAAGTGGANRSWSTGVCNDLVNNADQATCEAQPDRKWSNGVCAVVMLGDDRNNVVCALHGGTWVTAGTCIGTWIMPNSSTYNPPLFTGTTSPGPGDQCLRCHNSVTEWNGPRIRDVDWYLRHGHKNMSREIKYVCSDGVSTTEAACTGGGGTWAPDGKPWAGPGYECSNPIFTTSEACIANGGTWDRSLVIYPSDDSGNLINWATGQITVSGTPRNLTWIYGDWLAPLPRAIYRAPASSSQVCDNPLYTTSNCVANGGTLYNNAGASYSCGRCHTTGWTSDAAINASKLPERSFPGITWNRNSNAGFGVVNLTGGVTGDANKYSSWDYWGIGCARCHSSAVDNTTNGGVPPHTSPTGMSSHHSAMTAPDAGSGYCTDSRFTAQTQCESNGGTWQTACSLNPTASICTNSITTQAACVAPAVWVPTTPWCSNALYTNQTDCEANLFVWQAGWCTRPDLTTSGTCTGGTPTLTWRTNGSQASCQLAGGTWGFSFCSVPGVCNNPLYTAQPACESNGGQWAAATDVIRCEDAGGRWTGNKPNRGQIITRLCMDCHRQETGGMPYANTSATVGAYDTTNPGLYLKVGPAHGTFGFVSHPHGNQFLNSAHGKFSGTFNQVATGSFNFAMTGLYTSFFQIDAEAANTGNGCTGCHEVHKSVVEEAFEPLPGQEGAFRETCTDCHAGQYNKDLTKINHLPGPGTPLEEMATEAWEACVSCHMPDGMHLYRVNPDVNYSTFPVAAITASSSAQCTAAGGTWAASSSSCTVNANTAPDGAFTNAVWVDVDHSCGQCHGGGSSQATTTGTAVSGNKQITVASSAGFLAGERIKVAGAGALEYDDEGLGRGDFESYIVSVPDGTHVNLVGAPSLNVSGAAVIQNPTRNDAPYYPKSVLAPVARGMHESAGVTYGVTFTTATVPNSLTVNVDAAVDCGPGVTCPDFLYDWNWGDATAHGAADPDSHTYLTAGMKSITLTVRLDVVNPADRLAVGTSTRNVTFPNPDLPPTAAGTCTWTANTWNMNVLDSSTDDGPDADTAPDVSPTLQVIVDWGDGTLKTFGTAGASLNHTYARVGNFTVTQKVIDSKLQVSSTTCAAHATPAYFTIGGTVKNSAGTLNLASATVQVKRTGTTSVVRTMYTLADGTFTTGATLKAGSYDLVITKTGYTFGVRTIAVGPSSLGNVILANPPGITVRRILD